MIGRNLIDRVAESVNLKAKAESIDEKQICGHPRETWEIPETVFAMGTKINPPGVEMLKAAATNPACHRNRAGRQLGYPPDNVKDMRHAFEDLGMECVSIIPDLFGDKLFSKGSFSSSDAAIRGRAVDHVRAMCEAGAELGCELINLWPGQDGYDYLLSADYENERAWLCESVVELADLYPDLRFALEYKPKEPRTHSYLARMADTLLLAMETGAPNVGVTIDTGHAFVGW